LVQSVTNVQVHSYVNLSVLNRVHLIVCLERTTSYGIWVSHWRIEIYSGEMPCALKRLLCVSRRLLLRPLCSLALVRKVTAHFFFTVRNWRVQN
jgi:hypothetical protein